MTLMTEHTLIIGDAGKTNAIPDESIDLVVTSPPYPMIAMWDDLFCGRNKRIAEALKMGKGWDAFELMHQDLMPIWNRIYQVLKPGGFACINIGDATRKIGEDFCLYPNHAWLLNCLNNIGFSVLPDILWRKQTNSPTKFMGSGMLPAGAYVTLEHEYILIVRKGGKRVFRAEADRVNRRQSAIFWEERNEWFSDVWMDLKGTVQHLKGTAARSRSGAFPFELAYRLINMYSVRGDTVLDPFAGTGTTMAAAMTACRNSVGAELDPTLLAVIQESVMGIVPPANQRIEQRLAAHLAFVQDCIEHKRPIKYINQHYGFPVVTNQEKALLIDLLQGVEQKGDQAWSVAYDRMARISDETGKR
jgi:DNA modification methylase